MMLPFHVLPVTFVHCTQTAEDIFVISFAYDSTLSLPDLCYVSQPFLLKFCPKVTTALLIRVLGTFGAHCG